MSSRIRYENEDVDDQGLFTNRSTMMANFEEWIKMATDNKINSRNSWNFALIDYFHDLNVLRDSENNINFQKASATLDGCVKIYSSRVDSVTTETGKLLSGLAQKKLSEQQEKANAANTEGADNQRSNDPDASENDIQIDPSTGLPIANDIASQTRRWNHNRVLETTLVDFDVIKMKELDQELNIDPLFKKALVDFDEGGAKSLLLNTLNIDKDARVVFDAAMKDSNKDDADEPEQRGREFSLEIDEDDSESDVGMDSFTKAANTPHHDDATNNSVMIDDEVLALGMDFINFSDISNAIISPSMQQLPKVFEDINKAKNFIEGINSKFDNFLSEKELEEAVPELGYEVDEDNDQIQADGSINLDDNFDGGENGHGEVPNVDDDDDPSIANESAANLGGVFEQELMSYFDENLTKTWRGREHWKVRNFKKKNLLSANEEPSSTHSGEPNRESGTIDESRKKKKGPLEIDFFALDDNFEEAIFASKKRTNIDLPLKSRTSESHFLLPDDFHFTTQRITRLFIKPQQTMSLFQRRRHKKEQDYIPEPEQNTLPFDGANEGEGEVAMADEHFWAENYERKEREENEQQLEEPEQIVRASMENPFEDDGGVDFNQAFDDEEFKDDGPNSLPAEEPGKFPFTDNKVNFSRVSKKVDVKKLKDNIWSSIKALKDVYEGEGPEQTQTEKITLKFTDIAVKIAERYTNEARKDISTSFCFICLLHLANEHGLEISSADNYEDLNVVLSN